MEFPLPIGAPRSGESLPLLPLTALALVALQTSIGALRRVRIRVSIRRPRLPRSLGRVASLAGLAFAFASGPAVAGTRSPVTPARRLPETAPPWSDAGGFPPPRPLARIEAGPDHRQPPSQTPARVAENRVGPAAQMISSHRVIHRERARRSEHGEVVYLFPRLGRSTAEADRAEAMSRHPSGKLPRDHHRVRPGDSLWSIAEQVLGTDDPRAVARYWPRIHRANRSTIGPDPNVIRPGQILELPDVG